MNDSELLAKLHAVENEALCEIDKICKDNGITYFLRGGSVLGAVKYNDFVPWDDDIDIALPRKDYEKLIEIMPPKFGNGFLFVSYRKTINAHCYFPRVILSDGERTKKSLPKNNERGLVLIDILPLDGMPDSEMGLRLHIVKAYFYRILASLWTLDVTETVSMHGGKKDKVLKILHSMRIHKLYKQDTIYKKLDALYSKYEFGETHNCGMLASSKLKKEIVPYSWFENGTQAIFNNLIVKIPKRYDEYLKKLFGEDYATTEPAIEDRKKSHITGG